MINFTRVLNPYGRSPRPIFRLGFSALRSSPSHDHHHVALNSPTACPGPPGGEEVTGRQAQITLFGISHTHRHTAEDYGPRHLTTLDGTKAGRHNRHEVSASHGRLVRLSTTRSNIKSNDVHGVTIVCLVDIFDKIPRSRLNDESSRMVAHFRTTWYRKVEECSAVSLCGNQILWSLQFESFRR